MSRDASALLPRLGDAAKQKAKAEAAAVIGELAGASFDGVAASAAEQQLKSLIKNRWFDLAGLLGVELVRAFADQRGIRKRYAQALIERGELVRAREHFEQLSTTAGIGATERNEYLGLVGRTFKQQFINTERQSGHTDGGLLRRAIDVYYDAYDDDPQANTWHGINAVALLDLARRRDVTHPQRPNAAAIAQKIIDDLLLADGREHWDAATLAESHLALKRWDGAANYLREYLWYPGADAFSFGSTLRQLEEIWEMTDPAGAPLLTLLRARLIEMESGCVQLNAADVRAAQSQQAGHYEKVFGADHFTTLTNYRTGLERCGSVARIGRDLDRGDGTGFLMQGADLDPRLQGPVLVTNAHVIDPTGESGGLSPDEVVISFQVLADVDPSRPFMVESVVWSSKRTELDVTIVRLKSAPSIPAPYPVAKQMPTKGARVVAIGHPGGGTLSLSLNDNELLDFETPGCKVHYRTPTEGGSSGSPIFTKEWRLLGVHHFGGDDVPRLNGQAGTYQANEGTSIQSVREALAAAAIG